jgi:hypothetical protein
MESDFGRTQRMKTSHQRKTSPDAPHYEASGVVARTSQGQHAALPDDDANPYRLTVFTNTPSESLNPDPEVWTLSDMLVLRFYPGMNELLNRKLYAIRFWRPEPPKHLELL